MDRIPLFPNLRKRAQLDELMDAPDCDSVRLENTLRQFAVINRCLTRVRSILKRYVISCMQRKPEREYHLVDLGAGACETAAWLLGYARERGLKLSITACDHDPRVVAFARANHGSVRGLDIIQRDAIDICDLAPFDFVFANHLLHHLSTGKIVELLRHLDGCSETTLIFNDILRNRFAYSAYFLGTALFFRNSFARYDGLASIRKGFKPEELRRIIQTAVPESEATYRIFKMVPSRVLVVRKASR